MCRDPRIVLSKDLVCVRGFNSLKQWKDLIGSVGLCGLALAGDLPIFWRFYHIFNPSGQRQLETGMDYLSLGMEVKCSEPTWQSRVSFYRAFNITPDEQVAIESYYDSITTTWLKSVPFGIREEVVLEILNIARGNN
jgi:hypothetical protein